MAFADVPEGNLAMRNLIFGAGGSLTALVTPFHETLVDWEAASNLGVRQIERGTAALIVCGSTGEAAALALPEHARLVRVVVETASGRVPVIAGCTASSTAAAVELGHEAASAGADAVLCAARCRAHCWPEGCDCRPLTADKVARPVRRCLHAVERR